MIGNFLALHLDRDAEIEVDGVRALATLRRVEAGQGRRHYYFEIRRLTPEESGARPGAPPSRARRPEPSRHRQGGKREPAADAAPPTPRPRRHREIEID